MKYYTRIVEETLRSKLTDERIINIVGPRECGKTTVGEKFASSTISFDEKFDSYEKLSEFRPELLIEGEKPLLINDIERIPVLEEVIATSSKNVPTNGLFITTNSQTNSGTVQMYPLSLFESGDSTGDVKILDLFENPDLNIDGIKSSLELEDLVDVTCRGGFPKVLSEKEDIDDYIQRVICDYMPVVGGAKRNQHKVEAILKVYSDNIYTYTKNSEILRKIKVDCPNIAKSTYYHYINDLKDLYIIDEIPAWSQPVKSPSSMRSISRKGFCDPSIPIAILNLNQNDLIFDLEKFEYFFKNLCYRDLKVYSSHRNGTISYYADRYGCNIDCILEIDNGDYALINFELSSKNLEKTSKQLSKFSKLIERKINCGKLSIKKPKFLAIITASNLTYTYSNGVKIIPIGILK